jgi:hypothetical protein
MSIKLVLLKSGEDIVSDVTQMLNEDGNVIGYYLKKPCIVKMKNFSSEEVKNSGENVKGAKINLILYPWMPLTKDLNVPIPNDWVVTITEPIDQLVLMYKKDVLNFNKEDDQSTNSDEQPDTDNED